MEGGDARSYYNIGFMRLPVQIISGHPVCRVSGVAVICIILHKFFGFLLD